MQFNPHVSFNGNCEEAFRFYQKVMGGDIVAMMPYQGTPAESYVPEQWHSKIMHAALQYDGGVLMGADAPPERYQTPEGFGIGLELKSAGEAERIFNALAEGGQVTMPLQATFWAVSFGMLTDRFGIPWMINCGKPDDSGATL